MIEIGKIDTHTSNSIQRWYVDVLGDEIRIFCNEETSTGLGGWGFNIIPDASAILRELLKIAERVATQDHRQLELIA